MRTVTITKQDGSQKDVMRFEGTVKSISAEPTANSNGTPFYRCTIQFADANGTERTLGARAFGGSVDRAIEEGNPIEAGKKFMCEAEPYVNAEGEPRLDLRVSHLTYRDAVTSEEMFGFFGMQAPVNQAPANPVAERVQ